MFQGVRGMPDVLPEEAELFFAVEKRLIDVCLSFGFSWIRLPILENASVFHRGVGDYTDIVQKEVYTFEDRNQELLALRPEGTAGLMRSVLQHHLAKQTAKKLFYLGPMFRYERPQKGRQRQFTQMGIEHLGAMTPSLAVSEMILLSSALFQSLELQKPKLLIHSLGGKETRIRYKEALVSYFEKRKDSLDEESRVRLLKNPLRILDSKNKQMSLLLEEAPKLSSFLSPEEELHFQEVQKTLSSASVSFEVDACLVRGLDYYNDVVFEWTCEGGLGAQDAIGGGGQYDVLASSLGASYEVPSVGLAVGIERLVSVLLHQSPNWLESAKQKADIFLVLEGENSISEGLSLQKMLLEHFTLKVYLPSKVKSLKAQYKEANQSGASLAILVQNNSKKLRLKPLRTEEEELELSSQELINQLKNYNFEVKP